jgi:hypothetical protein
MKMEKHDWALIGVMLVSGLLCVLLVGCEDRFRYKCQDPANFELAECKPPICTATATCPDQLTKPEKETK